MFQYEQQALLKGEITNYEHKDTSISPEVTIRWYQLTQPYPKADALLLKSVDLSRCLAKQLAVHIGLLSLSNIEQSFLYPYDSYEIVWRFRDPILFEKLKDIMRCLQLDPSHFVFMSHYRDEVLHKGQPSYNTSISASLRINRLRVWVPTGLTLSPRLPVKNLFSYLTKDLRDSGITLDLKDLWLTNESYDGEDTIEDHQIYTLCSLSPSQSLYKMFDIELKQGLAHSYSPLSFLEPVHIDLDYQSGSRKGVDIEQKVIPELKSQIKQNQLTVRALQSSKQLSSNPDEKNQVETNGDDAGSEATNHLNPISQVDLSQPEINQGAQEYSNRELRAQLRTLSFPQVKPNLSSNTEQRVSPRERARQWLQDLNLNAPRLLSNAILPEDWLSLAQQLWWIEEYERAIDALVWLFIEFITLPNTEPKDLVKVLSGWQSRLSRPIESEGKILMYTRLSLNMLLQSEEEAKNIRLQNHEAIHQIRYKIYESDDPQLHYLWLLHYCFIEDKLLNLQAYEWINRTLALGLSPIHCDPSITTHLIFEPSVTLSSVDLLLHEDEIWLESNNKRLRIWGYRLIESFRHEILGLNSSKYDKFDQKTALIYEQVNISTHSLQNVLLGHQIGENNTDYNFSYDVSKMALSAELSYCLLSRYTFEDLGRGTTAYTRVGRTESSTSKKYTKSQVLSVLRTDPQLEFWRHYSNLNRRSIEATPLGASFRACLENTPHAENYDKGSYIDESVLELSLSQALRRLRPKVKSYHSFKTMISASIDHALKGHNTDWLHKVLQALETWIVELSTISTVPYEILTQLDFEILRVGYALKSDQDMTELFKAWITRWFTKANLDINWRQVIAFVSEFSTTVLDKLSAYVSPTILIEVIHAVLEHLEQHHQRRIDKEKHYSLVDMSLEKASYQFVLNARMGQFKNEQPNEELSGLMNGAEPVAIDPALESALDHFTNSLMAWLNDYEQGLTQQDVLLKTGFKSPLKSWLYQLQYLNTAQLNRLSDHLIKSIRVGSMSTCARAWFMIESAFLSMPLFQTVDHPRLKIWLRGRERILREKWKVILLKA